MGRAAVGALALVLAACQLAGAPLLVRDEAGLFSAEARAEAESRLQTVARLHGVWTFVVTDREGDPPRMLDEPMDEADARGVRAVAALIGPERLVGGGYSDVSFDRGDSQTFMPPDVDDLLAAGEADEALARIVDYLETWAASPQPAGDPPPFGGEAAPPGAP